MLNNRVPDYATEQRNRERRELPAATVNGKCGAAGETLRIGDACSTSTRQDGHDKNATKKSSAPKSHRWTRIMCAEVPHLRYLVVAAADHSSFCRATAALNITQPTLSKSVRQLEDRLGVSLFS